MFIAEMRSEGGRTVARMRGVNSDADWTSGYFEPPYEELHPFPAAAQTDEEVAALCKLVPATPASILDVGCGPGRHAVRLARQGYTVVGVDPSARFLAMARAAATAGDRIEFVEGDARDLDFVDEFDIALSLFSSWGYFDDVTNQDVLRRVAERCVPAAVSFSK